MTPEEQIETLKKEVEYWKEQYHKAKDENERLALDLGIRDQGHSQWTTDKK
jgi:hypothetical protein